MSYENGKAFLESKGDFFIATRTTCENFAKSVSSDLQREFKNGKFYKFTAEFFKGGKFGLKIVKDESVGDCERVSVGFEMGEKMSWFSFDIAKNETALNHALKAFLSGILQAKMEVLDAS